MIVMNRSVTALYFVQYCNTVDYAQSITHSRSGDHELRLDWLELVIPSTGFTIIAWYATST